MKPLDAMQQPVSTWVARALGAVTPTNPVHIHSDELARLSQLEGHTSLEVAWFGYFLTISLLAERLERYMPVLSIDLECSQSMDTRLPDLTALERQLSSEPPSIYIVERKVGCMLKDFESYRCPLPKLRLYEPELPDVYFFYECLRSAQGRANGWEFSRTISGEHYPSELRPT